jgi:hypothetical protein
VFIAAASGLLISLWHGALDELGILSDFPPLPHILFRNIHFPVHRGFVKSFEMAPKAATSAAVADDSTSTASADSNVVLPSPSTSVGPEWDQETVRIDEGVLNLIRLGPIPFNASPIHFTNPNNYCYRNAMMAMLMYTPSFLRWVQRWHMDREWLEFKYKDHILKALDNVGRAYHANGTNPPETRKQMPPSTFCGRCFAV